MVKGRHKQMVVLRTSTSPYYEEAYFVLREGREKESGGERSMMAEANRILDESQLMPQPCARRLSRRGAFFLGVLSGGAGTALLVLIFLLI